MKTEKVSCNNCGGPLTVPDSANFVTCNHCSSQLAIRRTESVTFTEKLEQIGAKQEEMLERLDRIERQNQLAQIDRDWTREKERYMISDKHGRRHEPSDAAVFMSFVVAGFGVVWTIVAGSMFSPMALFGVIFVMIAIGMGIHTSQKNKDFRAARRRYQRRRRAVYGASADTLPKTLAHLENIPTPEDYLRQQESE